MWSSEKGIIYVVEKRSSGYRNLAKALKNIL